MTAEQYYKIAKGFLLLPLLCGVLMLVEQLLPLQTATTYVESKHTSQSIKGDISYNIDFPYNNDQFTTAIYNAVNHGDTVTLQLLYFTKEVRTLQPAGGTVMPNDTNEVYFQLGLAVVMVLASVHFLRKKYHTNTNYRYLIGVCLIGLGSLLRIIHLNT